MLLLSPPNYRVDDHLESRLDWLYTPKSEEEINKLALDIVQGRVFHSGMVHHLQDLQMVFLPLALMDRRYIRRLQSIGAYLFYEDYAKAGPRSVNGNPCFFSFKVLNNTDTERLDVKVKRLAAAMDAALAPESSEPTYDVIRIDEHGTEVTMRVNLNKIDAEALVERMTERGHKQTYVARLRDE